VALFVVLEGIDGSGKTSVAKTVHETLVAEGRDAVLTSEPTRTWLGEAVRRGIEEDTEPVTESFLFLADRAAHTVHIREWLAAGKTVVCDRYTDSTLAYQGARLEGRVPDPVGWLRALSARVAIDPDLILLLRIPPRVGLERIASRDKRVRFEEAAFLERVAALYDALARENTRYRVLDASRPLPEVTETALRAMHEAAG